MITQLEWIHIFCFKLTCINPSDGIQTLATNGLKQKIFNSNLSLVSQELFSNDYKKISGMIFSITFEIIFSKYLFKGFIEFGYHTIRQWYDIR